MMASLTSLHDNCWFQNACQGFSSGAEDVRLTVEILVPSAQVKISSFCVCFGSVLCVPSVLKRQTLLVIRWVASLEKAGGTWERCRGWRGRWSSCQNRFPHFNFPWFQLKFLQATIVNMCVPSWPSTPGHFNWRGNKCAHHRTLLLHPVSPTAHPSDGGWSPRRSPHPHSGPPSPQWRGIQHLADTPSLLRRRAADTLVDAEESHIETS